MSETKKLEELLQEMSNRLQNIEKKQSDQLQSTASPTNSKTTETPKVHEHTLTDVFDCPDCGDKYLAEAKKRLAPKILEEQRNKIKSMKHPALCEDCGEIVDTEENEECPTCHGRNL